jgi:hypothetical protein
LLIPVVFGKITVTPNFINQSALGGQVPMELAKDKKYGLSVLINPTNA